MLNCEHVDELRLSDIPLFEVHRPGVLLNNPFQGRRLSVAKLGDSKRCVVCGGAATLCIVQPSFATLGWVDDRSSPYDVPPMPMWQCERCAERQLAETEVEA